MTISDNNYEHLYDVPIAELNLSDEANTALARTGITAIGDCIDFYVRLPDVLISGRFSFFKAMSGEVEEKLIALGYWSYVENKRSSS